MSETQDYQAQDGAFENGGFEQAASNATADNNNANFLAADDNSFNAEKSEEQPQKRGKAPPDFKSSFEKPVLNVGDIKGPGNGCRLFIGNLESEVISREELAGIFAKYGTVEEISMHKSYAFIQFSSEPELLEAIKFEQGRLIGSRKIDIQRAKHDKRPGPSRIERSYRDSDKGIKRRRDDFRERSPPRSKRYSSPPRSYKPIAQPKNGMVVKILLLGEMQRKYAQRVGEAIGDQNVPWEVEMLDGRSLSQALRDAEANLSRYALIVGRDNVNKGTTTIKILHLKEDQGKCPTYDLETDQLVDLIVSEERKLGFAEAGSSTVPAQSSHSHFIPQSSVSMAPASNNGLAVIQQQLNNLTQQLTQITSASQIQLPIQQPQMSLPHMNLQPTPYPSQQANDLQAKILEQQTILQQQVQHLLHQSQQQTAVQQPSGINNYIPQIGMMAQAADNSSIRSNASIQATTSAPRPAASLSQLADLSKLLNSLQKNKR